MPSNSARLARLAGAASALVIAAALLGPALSASAAKTGAKSTTTTTPSLECSAAQLAFSSPAAVSAVTGEEAFTITLTNVSTRLCRIHGYPAVRFYTSSGRLLTFGYAHTSLYFKRQSPKVVTLAPRGRAYFKVAKYRCDQGQRYVSSFFYLIAPYTSGQPWVEHAHGDSAGVMPYCKGSSHGPGQTLGISPIVSSLVQLSP